MKLLDRYLIFNYLLYFFSSALVFTTVFLLIDVLGSLNRFSNVSGSVFLAYYANYIPMIAYQMNPIAAVMGTVFLFVSLQRKSELVALFSFGYSLERIFFPISICILCSALFGWYLGDFIVPSSMDKRDYYYYVELKKKPHQYNRMKKSNIWFRTPDAIVNFGTIISPQEIIGAKIIFLDKEVWRPERIILAENLRIKQSLWSLSSGTDTLFDSSGNAKVSEFKDLVLPPLQDLEKFQKAQGRSDSLTFADLSDAIRRAEKSGMASKRQKADYSGRWAFIFSGVFLSLLALPMTLGRERSSSMFVGLAVALMLILGYWFSYNFFLNLGRYGSLNPYFAPWVPSFVTLLISFFALRRAR